MLHHEDSKTWENNMPKNRLSKIHWSEMISLNSLCDILTEPLCLEKHADDGHHCQASIRELGIQSSGLGLRIIAREDRWVPSHVTWGALGDVCIIATWNLAVGGVAKDLNPAFQRNLCSRKFNCQNAVSTLYHDVSCLLFYAITSVLVARFRGTCVKIQIHFKAPQNRPWRWLQDRLEHPWRATCWKGTDSPGTFRQPVRNYPSQPWWESIQCKKTTRKL